MMQYESPFPVTTTPKREVIPMHPYTGAAIYCTERGETTTYCPSLLTVITTCEPAVQALLGYSDIDKATPNSSPVNMWIAGLLMLKSTNWTIFNILDPLVSKMVRFRTIWVPAYYFHRMNRLDLPGKNQIISTPAHSIAMAIRWFTTISNSVRTAPHYKLGSILFPLALKHVHVPPLMIDCFQAVPIYYSRVTNILVTLQLPLVLPSDKPTFIDDVYYSGEESFLQTRVIGKRKPQSYAIGKWPVLKGASVVTGLTSDWIESQYQEQAKLAHLTLSYSNRGLKFPKAPSLRSLCCGAYVMTGPLDMPHYPNLYKLVLNTGIPYANPKNNSNYFLNAKLLSETTPNLRILHYKTEFALIRLSGLPKSLEELHWSGSTGSALGQLDTTSRQLTGRAVYDGLRLFWADGLDDKDVTCYKGLVNGTKLDLPNLRKVVIGGVWPLIVPHLPDCVEYIDMTQVGRWSSSIVDSHYVGAQWRNSDGTSPKLLDLCVFQKIMRRHITYPSSLKTLLFAEYDASVILENQLPKSLTRLRYGSNVHSQSIDFGSAPVTDGVLAFLPDSIQDLHIFTNRSELIPRVIKFPAQLRKLSTNLVISVDSLPDTVETISVCSSKDRLLCRDYQSFTRLPSCLTVLKVGYPDNLCTYIPEDLPIPPTLLWLYLGKYYMKNLPDLSNTKLTKLKWAFPYADRVRFSMAQLPPTLNTLAIGGTWGDVTGIPDSVTKLDLLSCPPLPVVGLPPFLEVMKFRCYGKAEITALDFPMSLNRICLPGCYSGVMNARSNKHFETLNTAYSENLQRALENPRLFFPTPETRTKFKNSRTSRFFSRAHRNKQRDASSHPGFVPSSAADAFAAQYDTETSYPILVQYYEPCYCTSVYGEMHPHTGTSMSRRYRHFSITPEGTFTVITPDFPDQMKVPAEQYSFNYPISSTGRSNTFSPPPMSPKISGGGFPCTAEDDLIKSIEEFRSACRSPEMLPLLGDNTALFDKKWLPKSAEGWIPE